MKQIKLQNLFSKYDRVSGYRLSNHESIILMIAVSLLFYTVMRAKILSFTHDESLSYFILHGIGHWHKTANNHFLNTFLMGISKLFFGDSEIALRLPNVAAHVLFMGSGWLILKRLESPVIIVCGFLLLNLNPFILDFFSLARGYGLSLGFMVASICFFIKASQSKHCKEQKTYDKHLLFAFFFSALGVLSSFTLLIYHFALFIIVIAEKLSDYYKKPHVYRCKDFFKQNKNFFIGNFSYIVLIAAWLIYLKNKRELYYGGKQDFWHDTVYSLVQSSLYSGQCSKSTIEAIAYIIAVLFLMTVGLAFYTLIINKKPTTASRIVFISVICIVVVVLQHYVLGTLYPVDRTALFFLPLFFIGLIFSIDDINSLFPKVGNKIVVLILIVLCTASSWHFIKNMNLTYTYTWKYDANTKKMMNDLHKQYMNGAAAPITLGVDPSFEPATNYYRLSRRFSWLEPTTRAGVIKKEFDFYYVFERQIEEVEKSNAISIINRYSPSSTILARLEKRRMP